MEEFTESNQQENNGLSDFLIDVALLTDADQESEDDKNKVTLMTVHAAKGLEFDYVFIVGLEENLFPSQLSVASRADLEEERRLFYVALTRAKQKAFLSYALSRYKWGSLNQCEVSRFIDEIDPKFIDFPQNARPRTSKSSSFNDEGIRRRSTGGPPVRRKSKPLNSNGAAPASNGSGAGVKGLKAGMEVSHERFGKGKVLKVEGDKATVFFPNVGQKQLLLKFARLTILK